MLVHLFFSIVKVLLIKTGRNRACGRLRLQDQFLHIVDDTILNKDDYFWKRNIPEDYSYIHYLHNDVRELKKEDIVEVSKQSNLYKQHIPPTVNNKLLLQNVKNIILLRNPEDILLAYRRAFLLDKINKHYMKDFIGIDNDKDWIEKSKELGILDDLLLFYDGWKDFKGDNVLLFHFSDIVNNIIDCLNDVSKFFNLNLTVEEAELPKILYTR